MVRLVVGLNRPEGRERLRKEELDIGYACAYIIE
jgi:hypothetical protein